ncbi:MAG: PTS sugar transporter subunit IIB [Allobaculum sp.]
MKTILLACSAGVSTSMLVRDMRVAAADKGMDCKIEAKNIGDAKQDLNTIDILLLSPQVKHEMSVIKSLAPELPVYVIDMKDYGALNSTSILEKALALLD